MSTTIRVNANSNSDNDSIPTAIIANISDTQTTPQLLCSTINVGVGTRNGGSSSIITTQDLTATDSGRESVTEYDSSLDEAHLSKKACTGEFYASSGSQTRWYLQPLPTDDGTVSDTTTIASTNEPSGPDYKDKGNICISKNVNEGAERHSDEWQDAGQTYDSEKLTKTSNSANNGESMDSSMDDQPITLSHQVRAVSSPSITDALRNEDPTPSAAGLRLHSATATCSSSDQPSTPAHLPTSQSVGVLQKFKRTLTNFNRPQQQQQQQQQHSQHHPHHPHSHQHHQQQQQQHHHHHHPHSSEQYTPAAANGSATPAASTSAPEVSCDFSDSSSAKYRFGPLIWRSSKERRKSKHNRRDKCNSGDSGIQIELENDEQFAKMMAAGCNAALGASSATQATPRHDNSSKGLPKARSVRRTSSVTLNSSAPAAFNTKAKILKKMEVCSEREAPESLPRRSLSQPNGLDNFGIRRTDCHLDDSDSDSVASHDETPSQYHPLYAEVLYSFTAAGPQELGLERGSLIEVLRKELGPWWFGRIKKEESTLVEEILDPELGWFPKEFVRIIQHAETDAFFLAHTTHEQRSATTSASTTCTNAYLSTTLPNRAMPSSQPPSATPNPIVSKLNVRTDLNSDDIKIVDHNNVTTIVIESSPTLPGFATANSPLDCNALAPSRSLNMIMDNADMLRRSAVKELLDTEVNYVKLLASICEGYLPAMSKRVDIFSPNSVRLIFSNITTIYKFQRKFLEALRKGIEQNQIAKVFLKMHKGFLCYSNYCNGYPRALIELESYDRVKDAKTILDNCRESENLAELPLSAHLLAPVQRICRYPLHLGEIMKSLTKYATTENANEGVLEGDSGGGGGDGVGVRSCGDADSAGGAGGATCCDLQKIDQLEIHQLNIADTRETIGMALEAMKSITEAVNEGKRHSETIARHQGSFQNFKGPPLHLHSTRFFLQIDATRQKQNLWNSSCTLFLFDNQLIYCKRDIIKRSQFIYKGRIFLDRCRVVNVRDGKMFGHTIKNSLRIYCEARDKWYDFSFRSANRKHRFLNTLALERQFGGKALYVSEMTGFEYAFDERDYSDQSDYEMPEGENGCAGVRLREYVYDNVNATSASGESSVPESPVKHKYSDTLPKKSQTRTGAETNTSECNTGSLGRRRLGNWFRSKPKSSSSTPNQSPTHKPFETIQPFSQQAPTEGGLVGAHEHARDLSSSSSC